MQPDAKFWDGVAQKYARSPIGDMKAYQYTLGRTRSYLKATDKVLELGCGTGSTSIELANDAGHITASDFSQTMLEIGAEKARAQNITNIDFLQLDASDQSAKTKFDVVMGFNLFHLVQDMDASFADVHSCLKPGGLFISKTPCLSEPGLGFKFGLLKLAIPVMQFVGKAPFVRFFGVQELETAVNNAGFEIIEFGNFPKTPPSRYLVARKI